MDLDIRKAVTSNLQNASFGDISITVNDALSKKDEVILPGLGVLFEIIWQRASQDERNILLNHLTNYFNNSF